MLDVIESVEQEIESFNALLRRSTAKKHGTLFLQTARELRQEAQGRLARLREMRRKGKI